jgi:hypothetical protein
VLGLVAFLGMTAACGKPEPTFARAAPPLHQVSSLLPCLGTPAWKPLPTSDAAALVQEITARVQAIRGHRFNKDVAPEFLPREEVGRRVADKLNTEYSVDEADIDRRILVAFGALPVDTNLRTLVAQLLSGQVVGFYDTKTDELVVADTEPTSPLGLSAQTTLAHELDHALVDAALGLPDKQLEGPSDAALATLALVEGDAVLAQEQFALTATPPDQQLGLAGSVELEAALAQAQLEDFPYVLRAELTFPYTEGTMFVCSLYTQGGWRAVDNAYRELPTTTAQILFPERYAAREGAVDPRDPGALGGPYRRTHIDTIGAVELMWLFQAPGDNLDAGIDDPLGAARAWAGGELHLWTDGPATAVGVALVDRTNQGTLCAAVADWYRAAFPGDRAAEHRSGEKLARDGLAQDAVLRCDGRDVRLGIAPDLDAARALTR